MKNKNYTWSQACQKGEEPSEDYDNAHPSLILVMSLVMDSNTTTESEFRPVCFCHT